MKARWSDCFVIYLMVEFDFLWEFAMLRAVFPQTREDFDCLMGLQL
jgi:hypothetical protein